MEAQLDQDTLHKFELINKKVEEINRRRTGVHNTKVEDELDRAELQAFIDGLNLTPEQKMLMDNINKSYERASFGKSLLRVAIIAISVMLELYLAMLIYQQLLIPQMSLWDTLFLFMLVSIFLFNLVQTLKLVGFMR